MFYFLSPTRIDLGISKEKSGSRSSNLK